MEKDITSKSAKTDSAKKESKGLASLLGRIDAAGENGLKRVIFNMPFLFFLVVLAAVHIANNHLAENTARNITSAEKEVRQLRWKYMTTTSGLMQKSKQSEVAKLVSNQGLKELRVPPYKIEVVKQ